MRVVGCFLEYDNKFVLVHRLPQKVDGDTWGLPSGKIKQGGSDIDAMKRELFEETGYQADDAELQLLSIGDFVSPRGDSITYVTYHAKLGAPHEMVLEESAHSEYRWVSIKEADAMDDLIHGLHDLFRIVGFVK